MRGEKWRHLLHVGHAADVPVADVLIKNRRLIKHCTVRRQAAHGMSNKGGRKRKDTPSGHNTRLCGSGSSSEWVMC